MVVVYSLTFRATNYLPVTHWVVFNNPMIGTLDSIKHQRSTPPRTRTLTNRYIKPTAHKKPLTPVKFRHCSTFLFNFRIDGVASK